MYKPSSAPPISTDVMVIGAGVAGISASKIFLEKNLDFWLLGSPYESQLAKAGMLQETSLAEGTIGLQYIEGEMEKLKAQGLNHRSSLCTGIEVQDGDFLVKTKYQNFSAKVVLITVGCKQGKLGFEGEKKFFRQGISDCAVCDFPLYKKKKIAVIGNHEYTKRAAEFLRKHTNQVSLLWYEDGEVPDVEGIEVFSDVKDVKVTGSDVVEQITFEAKEGNQILEIHGLFVEGEPVPNTDFLDDSPIELTQKAYIKVDDNLQTSVKGIWAAGDVTGETSTYDTAKQHGEKVAQLVLAYIS